MKQYLVVDLNTMLPLGMYKSAMPNMGAMICSQPIKHIECPEDFSVDCYEIIKDGEVVSLKKK